MCQAVELGLDGPGCDVAQQAFVHRFVSEGCSEDVRVEGDVDQGGEEFNSQGVVEF